MRCSGAVKFPIAICSKGRLDESMEEKLIHSYRIHMNQTKSLSHQWLRAGELLGQNNICASPVSKNFAIILHMHMIFLVGQHI